MRRVKNLNRYLSAKDVGKKISVYCKVNDEKALKAFGFSDLSNPHVIVPTMSLNRMTEENAVGKLIVRRDLPMETYEVDLSHWAPDFRGPGHHWVDVMVTRKMYRRERGVAEKIGFCFEKKDDGYVVFSADIDLSEENGEARALLAINILRFSFAIGNNFFTTSDGTMICAKIVREKWEFIRPGEGESMDHFLKRLFAQPVKSRDAERFQFLLEHAKNGEVFYGTQEFDGYFCVETSKAYILDNMYIGNAIYVIGLDKDWREITKKTKTEINDQRLATRIYHNKDWKNNLNPYL